MAHSEDYYIKAGDWRKQLELNKRRTRYVIFLFFSIYIIIGFILDLIILVGTPINGNPKAYLTLEQTFIELITFQQIPYATLSMLLIAAISLLVTYRYYDRIIFLGTTYHEVTADSTVFEEKQLYHVVEEMTVAAGLKYNPRVFIIEADYMNAFATGYSERSALVAVTCGLMNKLNRAELQAVMAHELSHIRHSDIKLTLMASVLTNIMLIVIDILFYSVIYGRQRKGDNKLFILIIFLRYFLPVITLALALYLSRTREYMADAGCVELMRNNEPLASALMKIHNDYKTNASEYSAHLEAVPHEEVRQAAYLYDPSHAGLRTMQGVADLFSTHPTLEQRLEAIGYAKKPN